MEIFVHGLVLAHHEVTRAIIELIPVLVVDDLATAQPPVQLVLCDPTVHKYPRIRKSPISLLINVGICHWGTLYPII
jgi:hypothetical protein